MPQAGRTSLAPLTGARFLAALWVVLYHVDTAFGFFNWFRAPSQSVPRRFFSLLVEQGYLAVDFFFLLSGFILAYNYLAIDGTVRGGKRAFWVARIARIYPVYLLGIALGMVRYLSHGPGPISALTTIASHLLLLQSWIPGGVPLDLNPPAWSLAAEALFYALFPLLLPTFARLGRRSVLVAGYAAWVVYGLVLVTCSTLGPHLVGTTHLSWTFITLFNPLVRLPEFLVGLAFGLTFLQTRGAAQSTSVSTRHRLPSVHDVGIVVLLAGLGVLCVLATQIVPAIPVGNIMAIFALPLLAPLIYLLAAQRGVIAWALSSKQMTWLGEISYGVYILHWPLYYLIWYPWHVSVARMLPASASTICLLFAYFVILITAAGLSFHYLEVPARRAIRARWEQRKHISVPGLQPTPAGR